METESVLESLFASCPMALSAVSWLLLVCCDDLTGLSRLLSGMPSHPYVSRDGLDWSRNLVR